MYRIKPRASAETGRRRVAGALRGSGGWGRSVGFECRAAPVITDRAPHFPLHYAEPKKLVSLTRQTVRFY
jgi:hypothetical protein